MGLITKEVEVGIRGSNTKYYEDLGYTMPLKMNKYGKMVIDQDAKIVVKVEDLKPNSGIKVDTECDCCSKPSRMTYQGYTKHLHNGFIYCRNCALKILNSGENHPLWNPNLTKEERIEGRHYTEYTDFIKLVMARDNYTCQCCGQEHGDIEVHHLDSYDWCVEKRTDVTNGITLCGKCHKSFHSYYRYGNNTKQQFEKWFGRTVELLNNDNVLPSKRKIYDYEDNVVYEDIEECIKILKADRTSIHRCCNHEIRIRIYKRKDGTEIPFEAIVNTVKGHHLFWLDEYENMSEEEIKTLVEYKHKRYKTAICITTGEIFEKIYDAERKYNVWHTSIILCCKGKLKSSGKLPDGTKLVWMYYEDFLKLPQEEQNEILARNKDSSNDGSFVIHK